MQCSHLVCLVLDSPTENPLFQAPIGRHEEEELHILDIGTGKGTWAVEVADMLPNSQSSRVPEYPIYSPTVHAGTVRGVDLYPPPVTWTPPNCILEVDDVLQEWLWREPFDLIHMRIMLGSFDQSEWQRVYKQCFE